jgi:flagellar assembly protein FliH
MSRNQARFIPESELNNATEYDFSAVDQISLRFAAKLKAQEQEEERRKENTVRQTALNEGYAQGYAKGHAQATADGQQRLQDYINHQGAELSRTFGQLFAHVQAQIADSEQVMAQGVLELAAELARQVVRQELRSNTKILEPVIREAVGMLAVDCKIVLVRLHPKDLSVVSELMAREFDHLALTLIPDPTITPGGCLVEAAGTVVDGTLEKRWQRAVATLGWQSAWEGSNEPDTA